MTDQPIEHHGEGNVLRLPGLGSSESPKWPKEFGNELVGPARIKRYLDANGEEFLEVTMMPVLMTVQSAARLLTVSSSVVHQLLRLGTLEQRKIGSATRVTYESVMALAKT